MILHVDIFVCISLSICNIVSSARQMPSDSLVASGHKGRYFVFIRRAKNYSRAEQLHSGDKGRYFALSILVRRATRAGTSFLYVGPKLFQSGAIPKWR